MGKIMYMGEEYCSTPNIMPVTHGGTGQTTAMEGGASLGAYAYCGTESATVAKVAICGGFTLAMYQNKPIRLYLEATNTASSPTLNINGTGAKAIGTVNGLAVTTSNLTSGWYEVIYNGTNYAMFTPSVAVGNTDISSLGNGTLTGAISAVNGNVGTLSSLTTTAKGSAVGAINEINSNLTNNCAKYNGLSNTFSSAYTNDEIESAIASKIASMGDNQTAIMMITVLATGLKLDGGVHTIIVSKTYSNYYAGIIFGYATNKITQYVYRNGTSYWHLFRGTEI